MVTFIATLLILYSLGIVEVTTASMLPYMESVVARVTITPVLRMAIEAIPTALLFILYIIPETERKFLAL